MQKQRLIDFCPICRKPHPEGSRIDKMYCSKKCTAIARRSRERAAAVGERAKLSSSAKKMLKQLGQFAPGAAKSVQLLALQHGGDCAEAAIKLALTAYSEGMTANSPR